MQTEVKESLNRSVLYNFMLPLVWIEMYQVNYFDVPVMKGRKSFFKRYNVRPFIFAGTVCFLIPLTRAV